MLDRTRKKEFSAHRSLHERDDSGLDLLTRHFVLIASCVTLGHAEPQLRAHVEAALNIGATKEQIVEAILQLTLYAGGPAVRNWLISVRDLLARGM